MTKCGVRLTRTTSLIENIELGFEDGKAFSGLLETYDSPTEALYRPCRSQCAFHGSKEGGSVSEVKLLSTLAYNIFEAISRASRMRPDLSKLRSSVAYDDDRGTSLGLHSYIL
jgi:hypothetical protein